MNQAGLQAKLAMDDHDFANDFRARLAARLEGECLRRVRFAVGDQPVVSGMDHAQYVTNALRAAGVFNRRADSLMLYTYEATH